MISFDSFITNETGKKHLIPGQAEIYRGQCVQLIGIYLIDCFGQNLPSHPNAKDYWTYGIPGWSKVTGAPQKGDIAVYDGHGAYTEGHIAIVVNGTVVFEENADPDGSPAHQANRANTYLLGYLRKEGTDVPPFNEGDRVNINGYLYGADLHRHGDQIGKDWKTAMYNIFISPEYEIDSRVNAGDIDNLKLQNIDATGTAGLTWKNGAYKFKSSGSPGATVLASGIYQVK